MTCPEGFPILISYEKTDYPVDCLLPVRPVPCLGGGEVAERNVYCGPAGRSVESRERPEEARGLSLHEYGYHVPPGRWRVGRFSGAVGRRCVLVYLPVKGGKDSGVSDDVKTALKKGKFYPKLVLSAADGTQAQCFTYETYQADSRKAGREIKRQITALSRKQG